MHCLWKTFWQNWWWPVILLILLYLAMMFWPGGQWRDIEADVQAKVTSDLQAEGLNQLTVKTQNRGRDVLLLGKVTSEEEKSLALKLAQVAADNGDRIAPRVVEWAATVEVPPESIVFTNSRLRVDINANDVVLTGVLANQQQIDNSIATAKETFAPRAIINKLSIGKNIKPLLELNDTFASFDLDQGSITINDNQVVLLGEVNTQQQKQTVATNIASALGNDYTIDNRINVIKPKPIPVSDIAISKESLLCQNQLIDLLSRSKIFFQTSKASIKDKSVPLLNEIIDILKQCPDASIEVSGHTDSTGSAELNLSLSQNRADTVTNYLINAGITKTSIKAIGFGESKPIASNKTEQGRAQNRRIEFTIR